MPRKVRQLKPDLRQLGFAEDKRGDKGSHSKWIHPLLPGFIFTLSGNDGDDAQAYHKSESCEKRPSGCARYPKCDK